MIAVLGVVAVASLTPFCSCGTTAVVLGALASSVPWAPVVAFMVSSPLTSPSEYVLSTGVFGVTFATTYFVGAIVIGLLAGLVTAFIERTGALVGQARVRPALAAEREPVLVGIGAPAGAISSREPGPGGGGEVTASPCGCSSAGAVEGASGTAYAADPTPGCAGAPEESRPRRLAQALLLNGRRLLLFFVAFAALGYLMIRLIPTEVLTTYLGEGSFAAVPLAALLGIPMYLSSEGSLPMIASLMDAGMSPGAALAFLTTSAGTSIGAISGMLIIARWRVIALVIGSLFVGAILLGWIAPLWL